MGQRHYRPVRNLAALRSRWWVNIYFGWHAIRENGFWSTAWFLVRMPYFWREMLLLTVWTVATLTELLFKGIILLLIFPSTILWLRLLWASRQLYAAHRRDRWLPNG